MKFCAIENCYNRHYANGYCRIHYRRIATTGIAFKPPLRGSKICQFEDCGLPCVVLNWCNKHYQLERRKDPSKRISKEDDHINHLKYRYGITKEKYENLVLSQNNKCAICENFEVSKSKSGEIRKLAVDHCHETNIIRELLCRRCNNLLGNINDSVELLEKMKNYLIKHKKWH